MAGSCHSADESQTLCKSSFARDDSVWVGDQKRQQIKLKPSQLNHDLTAKDVTSIKVDSHFAEAHHGGRCRTGRASQHGLDSRCDFARRERLHDIVVGTEFKTSDAILLIAKRREQDDRHITCAASVAQNLETVTLREHQIEQHKVGFTRVELGHSFVAVLGFDNDKSIMGQVLSEHLAHHWLIFDDQHCLVTTHSATLFGEAISRA